MRASLQPHTLHEGSLRMDALLTAIPAGFQFLATADNAAPPLITTSGSATSRSLIPSCSAACGLTR